jgi:hypothetical protein
LPKTYISLIIIEMEQVEEHIMSGIVRIYALLELNFWATDFEITKSFRYKSKSNKKCIKDSINNHEQCNKYKIIQQNIEKGYDILMNPGVYIL